MKCARLLSLAIVLLSASGLWAQTNAPKETYYVFVRLCKAFVLSSTHENVSAAHAAAWEARNPKENPPDEVRIGIGDKKMLGEVVGYELWFNPCKAAWSKKGTFKTEKEALEAAAPLRKDGDIEIILRMNPAK